jgi:hypothetical protein
MVWLNGSGGAIRLELVFCGMRLGIVLLLTQGLRPETSIIDILAKKSPSAFVFSQQVCSRSRS